jgi:hypothetical protein
MQPLTMLKLTWPCFLLGLGSGLLCFTLAHCDEGASATSAKQALGPLQAFVGEWNGAGQPRRGSKVGAWSEVCTWAWHFSVKDKSPSAELRAVLKDGKYFAQLVLEPTAKAQRFRLTGTLPDGKTSEVFDAALDDTGTLIATRLKDNEQNPAADRPARITMKTTANGDRFVVLYERAAGEGFTRLAEVGATRVGGMFAAGAAGPECIVTGGRGTITVTHQGQTYYVCCSGCKEAFDADPAGIVAEYLARKKQ